MNVEQRHALDPLEPVSPEEVRALIERFGERQANRSNQPTVADVAESLQVEPATVAAMLQELRESRSQAEIKERLDRLERENAELRARSESPFIMGVTHHGTPQRMQVAVMAGLFSVLLLTLISRKLGAGQSSMPWLVFGVLVGLAGLMAYKSYLLRRR